MGATVYGAAGARGTVDGPARVVCGTRKPREFWRYTAGNLGGRLRADGLAHPLR
jgi:hypothetical protein